MIRLTAYSSDGWRDLACGSLAEARRLWAEEWSFFGILSLAEDPLERPTGWQSVAGYLLATRDFLERHAPGLEVVGYGDGSLSVVMDALFVRARWEPDSPLFEIPELPPLALTKAGRPRLTPQGSLNPDHALLDGSVDLPPETLLSDIPGMRTTAVKAIIDRIGAVTVGDLEKLSVDDVSTGMKYTGGRNARLIRRTLSSWKVPERGSVPKGHARVAAKPRPRVVARASGASGKPPRLLEASYPEWFHATPIGRLGLPKLMGRTLEPYGTVGGLVDLDVTAVTGQGGLGHGSVAKFRTRVADAFEAAERGSPAVPVPMEARPPDSPHVRVRSTYDLTVPFVDHVFDNFDLLRERERLVLNGRFGLEGPPLRLEDMAASMGVSRERVRQIQISGLDRLDRATGCLAGIAVSLAGVADEPIALDDLLGRPWTAAMPLGGLGSMLIRCGRLHILSLGHGMDIVCGMSQPRWASFREMLAQAVDDASADDANEVILDRFMDVVGAHADTALIRKLAGLTLAGGGALAAKARLQRFDSLVEALIPVGRTVGIAAMHRRLAASGAEIGPRSLEANLARIALHMGGGRYARLAGPCGANGLADACEAVMRSGSAGRRWTTPDLVDALRREASIGVGMVELERRLTATPRFERLGPQSWRLASSDGSNASVEDVAVQILEANGGPMPSAALREAVFERWGGRKKGQIRLDPRIAILDHGLWGLYDRDVPFDREVRSECVDAARRILDEGDVMTVDAVLTEMTARGLAPVGLNAQLLRGMLRVEAGMGADPGGTVRKGVKVVAHREGTFKKAVRDAFATAASGISREALTATVTHMTGRTPSQASISAAMRQHGTMVERNRWIAKVGEAPMPAPAPAPVVGAAGQSEATESEPVKTQPSADATPRVPVPPRREPRPRKGYPAVRKPRTTGGERFDWTPEAEEILRRMVREGRSSTEVRGVLGGGLTKNAISGKVNRMGLSVPRTYRD